MNAGMRPFLLSTALFSLALSGCASLTAEPTKTVPAATQPAAMPATAPAPMTTGTPPVPGADSRPDTASPIPATPAPPVIRPGECWVQAVVQPRPVSKPLEIVVRDAVNDIEITPPTLETARKEIIVREEGVTYRVEPPVYKRVVEKVLVRPEVRRSVVVPAVFEEREVQIEIEGARTVMERCTSSTTRRTAEAPVQMLCAREVPARTQTVKRKILVQPETTREVVEPALYKEISRWVIETPARAVPVDIPPRTAKLRVQEVATPEQIDEQQLPPEIQHLIATRYEGQPSVVFRRAVCDTDLTPALVESLQEALRKAGFDPGPMDGKFGKRTHHALLDYQRQNGLAHGALTYESLEHLGVPANR